MTATGFLFLAEPLLAEIGTPFWHSMAQLLAQPVGGPVRGADPLVPERAGLGRMDRAIVWGFAIGTGLLQLVWLLFLSFPRGRRTSS